MKNIKIQIATLFILLVGSFNLINAQNESVTIRMQLKEGQQLNISSTSDMDMIMTMEDTSMNMKMVMQQFMNYDVTEVDKDGNMTMNAEITRMNMEMGLINGFKVSYDTENPEASENGEVFGDAYSKMIGLKTQTRFSPTGEILDFTGLEELMEKTMGESLAPSLSNTFGDEAMKELMKQYSSYLPQKPISVGDSWEVDINWLGMKMTYVYTLTSIDTDVYHMDMKGKMNFDINEMIGQLTQIPNSPDMDYDINGVIDGYMIINKSDGWIQEMVQNLAVKGDMKIKLPEGVDPNEQEDVKVTVNDEGQVVMPMEMTMKQIMKREEM